MNDNGLAALAAALVEHLGDAQAASYIYARAILGPRGVFLPDGVEGFMVSVMADREHHLATIATLRAALKEAAHVHHVTTHSSIAAFADCDQPFCQRVRAALATAKEAGG